jgi:titin
MTTDSVTIQWYPPSSDGGAEITKYVILKKQIPLDVWEEVGRVNGHASTFTIISLRPGKNHYFGVYAMNSMGKGDRIETTRPITPQKVVRKCLDIQWSLR